MALVDSLMQLRRTVQQGNVDSMPSVVLLFQDRRAMEIFKCQVRDELRPIHHDITDPSLDSFQLVGVNVVIGVR